MRPTKEMFALWAKVRDGTMSRREFQRRMRPIRQQVEGLLLRGYYNARVHGFCKELCDYSERLWLFVEVAGGRADEQYGRAFPASRRDLAETVVRHTVGRGQSFRRTHANGDRNLPPPEPQRL
jgi:hypothetical protein